MVKCSIKSSKWKCDSDMLIGIIANWSHLCNDFIIWLLDNNIEGSSDSSDNVFS